jgi:hypothetical protein
MPDISTPPYILGLSSGEINCLCLYHTTRTTSKTELLVLRGTLGSETISILIDSGANPSYIKNTSANLNPYNPIHDSERVIELADGTPTFKGQHYVNIPFSVNQVRLFEDRHDFISAPIAYDIILGKVWLDKYNPRIDWPTNTLTFMIRGTEYYWECSAPRPLVESISALHLKRLTSKNTRTTRMWSAVFTNAIC